MSYYAVRLRSITPIGCSSSFLSGSYLKQAETRVAGSMGL